MAFFAKERRLAGENRRARPLNPPNGGLITGCPFRENDTALPKTDVARTLGRQVLRSGTSIGANYREARRTRSNAEFIAKIGDCLKEADESDYWLELLVKSDVIPEARLAALRDETDQLIAILTTVSKNAKRRGS